MRSSTILWSVGMLLASSILRALPDPTPTPPSAAKPPAPESSAQLPSGHPPVAGVRKPTAGPVDGTNPHAEQAEKVPSGRSRIVPDRSEKDSGLARGSVAVKVVDANEKPLPNVSVRLGRLRQSVAEGESRSFANQKTDESGVAQFRKQTVLASISYRASVKRGPATYASAPFVLDEKFGQSILLHVYPVVRKIEKAFVGARGFVFIEPRDDVFQFEMLFRFFNVGKVTWVPEDDFVIRLPQGWKGFSAQEGMQDTRAIAAGDEGFKLVGTFNPGQHDIGFRFQVPNDHVAERHFNLELPPHVAEMRVLAGASSTMSLEVEGFGPAQATRNDNGQRVLVAQRQLKPREAEMSSVSVRLRGIPTLGNGRWLAAGGAGLLAILGLVSFLSGSSKQPGNSERSRRDTRQARRRLLDELIRLEEAKLGKRIGPRTYRETRKMLLHALARLEFQTERS